MLNGFKSPQTIALIGSTSEIGQAILKHLPLENLSTCYLASRSPSPIVGISSKAAFVPIAFEATDTHSHEKFVQQLFSQGDLDLAIIAIGALGNDSTLSDEANALNAMQVMNERVQLYYLPSLLKLPHHTRPTTPVPNTTLYA